MPAAPRADNEEDRLQVLRSYRILEMQQTESLDTVCRIAANILETPIALLSISDADKQVFKGRCGFEGKELARELAPCGYAILGRKPLVVNDLTVDARFADNPVVLEAPFLRFYAGTPLLTADNYALGTLCGIDVQPRQLSERQIESLVDLSKTAMTLFEYHRMLGWQHQKEANDPETGALNRAAFLLEIERSIAVQKEMGYGFAIALLSLPGRCDLRAAAERLRASLPGHYALGRVGADRLAILCVGADRDDGEDVLAKLVDALQQEPTLIAEPGQVASALSAFSDEAVDAASALAQTEASLAG